MSYRRVTSMRLFGWVLAGLATAATLLMGVAPVARAYEQPPLSCLQDPVNEQGKTGSYSNRGNRITVEIASWTGDCARVVSVAVVDQVDTSAFVELGWSLGWAHSNSGGYTYFTHPQLFQAWKMKFMAIVQENNIRSLSDTQDQIALTVQDGNGNGVWTAWTGASGENLEGETMDVSFVAGKAIANSERHTTCEPGSGGVCDSAWSHSWHERRWSTGAGSYVDWPSDSEGLINDDPWYYYDHTSDTEHYIRKCASSGC